MTEGNKCVIDRECRAFRRGCHRCWLCCSSAPSITDCCASTCDGAYYRPCATCTHGLSKALRYVTSCAVCSPHLSPACATWPLNYCLCSVKKVVSCPTEFSYWIVKLLYTSLKPIAQTGYNGTDWDTHCEE